MKLVSMKIPKQKTLRNMKAAESVPMPDEPAYHWGLEVTLNADSLKKLKVDIENQSAGDTVFFGAKAKVTRLSINSNLDHSGKNRDNSEMGLQITDIAWGKPGD